MVTLVIKRPCSDEIIVLWPCSVSAVIRGPAVSLLCFGHGLPKYSEPGVIDPALPVAGPVWSCLGTIYMQLWINQNMF